MRRGLNAVASSAKIALIWRYVCWISRKRCVPESARAYNRSLRDTQTFIALNEPEYRRSTITDVKTNKMSYTMLNSAEEQKLSTFEEIVVRFVSKVLGGTDQPIWAGGTASEGRRIRLVVPGLMPPVILELLPSDIPNLTTKSLMESLNAQICRQRK